MSSAAYGAHIFIVEKYMSCSVRHCFSSQETNFVNAENESATKAERSSTLSSQQAKGPFVSTPARGQLRRYKPAPALPATLQLCSPSSPHKTVMFSRLWWCTVALLCVSTLLVSTAPLDDDSSNSSESKEDKTTAAPEASAVSEAMPVAVAEAAPAAIVEAAPEVVVEAVAAPEAAPAAVPEAVAEVAVEAAVAPPTEAAVAENEA